METPTERPDEAARPHGQARQDQQGSIGLAWQVGIGVGFIAVGDGLAMMLPGTSGGVRGAVLLAAGLAWLLIAVPRWMDTGSPRDAIRRIARLGLRLVPILAVALAVAWHLATPEALNPWFAVAWASLFFACLATSRA